VAAIPELMSPECANAWMGAVYGVVWSEGITPTNAARIYSYIAIAMYEAVAPLTSTLRTVSGQLTVLGALPTPPPGRVDAACILSGSVSAVAEGLFAGASSGSRQVLADTFTSQVAARRTAGIPAGVVSTSVEHGRRLGRALNAWIATDGYAGIVGRPYSPPVGPDTWRSTPPNFGTAIEP
jgi:hypothetical protein